MLVSILVTDQHFREIYEQYKNYAYTVCYNTLNRILRYFSREEIKDIIQESFLNLYKYLTKTEEVFSMKSLIARITELTTIKYIDNYIKHNSTDIDLNAGSTEPDPIDIVLENEDLNELVKAIKALHPRYSSVILLKNVHCMKLKDIAEMMDIPYNTILSRYRRGKILLSIELKKKSEDVGVKQFDGVLKNLKE